MFRTAYSDGELFVYLAGELDHHSARETLEQTSQALYGYLPRHCVLDLTGLHFMDSSGIALILNVLKQTRQMDVELHLVHAGGQPGRVLEASGVGRLLSVKKTESEGKK